MENTIDKKKEYDSLPVYYCKECLSLKVRYLPGIDGVDFCDDCNSTNIGECLIEEWEVKYKNKYGENHK